MEDKQHMACDRSTSAKIKRKNEDERKLTFHAGIIKPNKLFNILTNY